MMRIKLNYLFFANMPNPRELTEKEYLSLMNACLFTTCLEGLSQLTGKSQNEIEVIMIAAAEKHILSLPEEMLDEYLTRCLENNGISYRNFKAKFEQ